MDKLKFSQFGVMSVNYQLYSLEYALASIAKAGFRYVDLWGGAPHYSYFDEDTARERPSLWSVLDSGRPGKTARSAACWTTTA